MNLSVFASQRRLHKVIYFFILIHILGLFCFLVFNQFFQQDEWHSFGLMLLLKGEYVTLKKSVLELILGDRVGARMIAYTLFSLFKLNPTPYGLFAFFLHTTNAFLVFLLARSLTKKYFIALLASFFFLINELGNEAYTWFGTMNGSATSVLFFILSLLLYIKFLDGKKYINIFFSFILLWISLLFKETGMFAFILYPLIFLIYGEKKKNISIFIKTHTMFFIYAIILGLFLLKNLLFFTGDKANYVGSDSSFLPSLLSHSIQYPIEGVIQTFFPNSFIFIPSNITTRIINPSLIPDTIDFDTAVQNINSEITLLLLLLILGGIVTWSLKEKWGKISEDIKKSIFISFLFTILSFIPYIVINRSFSYLDSRHYYLAAVGGSILLAALLYQFYILGSKRIKIIIFIIGVGYLILHEFTLWSDFSLLIDRANTRERFLSQVSLDVPILPKKAVFYFTGNTPGYYGLVELKVPFQSGLGQVLMVIYTIKNQLNPNFFREESLEKTKDVGFLYDILGQGYREINGRGFGYYYDKKELDDALSKKLFKNEDVLSFYYDSEKDALIYEK